MALALVDPPPASIWTGLGHASRGSDGPQLEAGRRMGTGALCCAHAHAPLLTLRSTLGVVSAPAPCPGSLGPDGPL